MRNINPDGHTCALVIRKQRAGPFICKFCNTVFRTNSALFYHEKTVHSDTPSECEVCYKTFGSYLQLKEHMIRVYIEKTACNICGVLVKDIKEHHETVNLDDDLKRYRCEHCGKGFIETQKLKDHKTNDDRNQHEKRKHGQLFC